MTGDGRRRRARPAAARHAPAVVLAVVLAAAALVVLAGACGDSGDSGEQASPSPADTGPVVLTVKGDDATRTFTMGSCRRCRPTRVTPASRRASGR